LVCTAIDKHEVGGYNIVVTLHPQRIRLHRPEGRTVGLSIAFLRMKMPKGFQNGLSVERSNPPWRRKKK